REDARFKPEPLPAPEYSSPNTRPDDPLPPRGRPSAAQPSLPVVPGLRAPSLATTASGASPPGPALLTAAPLRRALLKLGLHDERVLSTALDGPTVLRAVSSDMLPTQVLQELRLAMS